MTAIALSSVQCREIERQHALGGPIVLSLPGERYCTAHSHRSSSPLGPGEQFCEEIRYRVSADDGRCPSEVRPPSGWVSGTIQLTIECWQCRCSGQIREIANDLSTRVVGCDLCSATGRVVWATATCVILPVVPGNECPDYPHAALQFGVIELCDGKPATERRPRYTPDPLPSPGDWVALITDWKPA